MRPVRAARTSRCPTARICRALTVAACLALAAALAACSADAKGADAGSRQPVTVLAAASLTEAMTGMAQDLERAHPDIEVRLSFGASSTIVAQVNQGAPADVIVLAGEQSLEPLSAGRAVEKPAIIARNTLEIATPPSNPGGVSSLADLARPTLRVVLCAPQVPCGKAAQAALDRAGITAHVVSLERDVKAALTKAELGEADAAIVYHSDIVSAGDRVRGVALPPAVNQELAYPIVSLNDRPATRALVSFALSVQGRKRLLDNGFQAP